MIFIVKNNLDLYIREINHNTAVAISYGEMGRSITIQLQSVMKEWTEILDKGVGQSI